MLLSTRQIFSVDFLSTKCPCHHSDMSSGFWLRLSMFESVMKVLSVLQIELRNQTVFHSLPFPSLVISYLHFSSLLSWHLYSPPFSTGLSISVTKRLLILSPSGAIVELPRSPRPILSLLTFYHKPSISLVICPLGWETERAFAEVIHHNYKPFAKLASITSGLCQPLTQVSITTGQSAIGLHVLNQAYIKGLDRNKL